MTDVLGVPAWALVLLAATAGGWLLLLAVLTTATRARPVRPGPAGLDLGDEPPAVVNLLTNGWQMTEDALAATLLDLAARDLVDLVQQGPEAERTVCVVRAAAPADLTPYERRVYDRVAALAAGGVVPVAALARGTKAQATRWWKGFRKEVIVDAQRRGLSRNRWGPGVKTLFSAASLVPAGAAALVGYLASDDGGAAWPAGLFSWAALSTYAASRNRQRDTPAGREAAARWLGLRDHLGRDEVFDTLPPAAVAIWDRYLGYGAATGVAGTASRVLAFGAQSERLAWSAYGGSWHRVRIRYPGFRAAEGRHPAVSALIGLLALVVGWYGGRAVLAVRRALGSEGGLGLSGDLDEQLDNGWTRLVLLALLAVFGTLLVWGAWTVLRSALDVAGRHTFEAEVLRIRYERDDDGDITGYQVALDDGRSERVRAWAVSRRTMPPLDERDVVSVTAGRRLRHVSALTVVRRGSTVRLDDGEDVLTQVVEDAAAAPAGPVRAAPFSAADVGRALGRPVNPPTETVAPFGLRLAEYTAVGGPERVLVQSGGGGVAAVAAGLARRVGTADRQVTVRDGAAVVRTGDGIVIVHVRGADPGTTRLALQRLADQLVRDRDRDPAPDPAG